MKPSKSQALQDQHAKILSNFRESMSSKLDADDISCIVEEIKAQVGSQPELTQALCDYVIHYEPSVSKGQEAPSVIDLIIEKEVAAGWGNGLAAAHLNNIEQTLTADDRKDSALITYIQILQRGKILANDSQEQTLLIQSGLVKNERGYLKVANALYAKAFNLKKIEQMLPGITKPVVVISPQTARNSHEESLSRQLPSKASKLYSKFAVGACGVAILAASISSYIRESGGMANASDAPALGGGDPALIENRLQGVPKNSSTRQSESDVVDRIRFDRGEEYSANSRWVMMMREFCDIPKNSLYFSPAQKHVSQLSKQHPEDIQLARDVVQAEKEKACSL